MDDAFNKMREDERLALDAHDLSIPGLAHRKHQNAFAYPFQVNGNWLGSIALLLLVFSSGLFIPIRILNSHIEMGESHHG